MMKEKFEEELGKNKYFVMKHGYIVILLTMALIAWSFVLITIDHKPLYQLVRDYYLR